MMMTDAETPRSASLASLPHKIRMITEDAFRALLNLSAELCARPAICQEAIPLLLKAAAYPSMDWATSRGRSWPTSCATALLEPRYTTTSSPRPPKA